MDTLRSSVAALRIPAAVPNPTASREFLHLKNTSQTSHHPPNHHLSSFLKSNSFPKSPSDSIAPHAILKPLSSPPAVHRSAASGYAAALAASAQSAGSLHSLDRDVERFSKLLRTKQISGILSDSAMSEREKGRVVREVAERGGFDRRLVRLIKMLIERKRLGILSGVLGEFERIYDEMCGTQRVLVCCRRKMEEERLWEIAKEVQKLSGAAKVKLRCFVHGGSV